MHSDLLTSGIDPNEENNRADKGRHQDRNYVMKKLKKCDDTKAESFVKTSIKLWSYNFGGWVPPNTTVMIIGDYVIERPCRGSGVVVIVVTDTCRVIKFSLCYKDGYDCYGARWYHDDDSATGDRR